jgi:hypothetical protein
MFILVAVILGIGHAFLVPALITYVLERDGSSPGPAVGTFMAISDSGITGILRFFPEANTPKALIVLSSQPPPTQFWINPLYGKPYHQFHPIEGIFFSVLLIGCYSLMDYRLKKLKANNGVSRSSRSRIEEN